jgi:hypothetical protein
VPASAGARVAAEVPDSASTRVLSAYHGNRHAAPPTATVAASPQDQYETAVQFAAQECVRLAEAGASVSGGAHDLLRWTSRRRVVIESAAAQVRGTDHLDPAIRSAAVAIVERALANGLLF